MMKSMKRFFRKPKLGGRRYSKKSWSRGVLAGLFAASLAGSALANPTGPTVKHGQVNITPGVQAQIQQLTDKAIIDWQSFSIGANEAVRFIQPSELAVILNRVTGQDPSVILGQLRANGNVFLINPNGILFGAGSQVNVGGLVASTLNITDQDFLAGNYTFFQDAGTDLAAVVNRGRVEVTDAGYAVLQAPTVLNEGTIVARSGNVVLAAGEQATLNLDGRDLIHYSLDGQTSEGTVLLAPGMLSDALAQTLGVEQAQRADKLIRLDDGSVRMVSSSGTLVQAGEISADGKDNLDAGSVLLNSTDLTLVANGSVTSASGQGINSDAGDVIALSVLDGDYSPMSRTIFEDGALLAASGGETGDAGFVEVSGEWVELAGDVDLSRTDGAGGLFLLDPPDVVVVDETFGGTIGTATLITDQFIETMLGSADFTIFSDPGGSVTLDVLGTSGGSDTGIQAPGALNAFTIETSSGGTFVDLNDNDIEIGGSLNIVADTEVLLGTGNLVVGGDFDIQAFGDTDFESAVVSVGGSLSGFIFGDINLGSSFITASDVDLAADGGNIDGNGLFIDTRGNPTDFSDGGGISLSSIGFGDIRLDNATLQFAPDGLSLTADGSIVMDTSLIESEFEQPPSALPSYLADISIDALDGDILLPDTNLRGALVTLNALDRIENFGITAPDLFASLDFEAQSNTFAVESIAAGLNVTVDALDRLEALSVSGISVSLTADSVILDFAQVFGEERVDISGRSVSLLGGAGITTPQRPLSGVPTIIIPEISISAVENINMGTPNVGGLRSARIFLETTGTDPNDFIFAAIDTTESSPFDIPTRLTASSHGNIVVRDIAPDPITNFALGIALARPNGIPGASSTEAPAIQSATGDVILSSAGNLDFGLGDGSTVEDMGLPLVQASGAVDIRALLQIRDRNSTSISADLLEVQTSGPVTLRGSSIGDFSGAGTEGRIEFDGESLVAAASVPDAPINVASANLLEFIDISFTGGELLIAESGIGNPNAATVVNSQVGGSGPRVLQMGQLSSFTSDRIRVSSSTDLFVDDFTVGNAQRVILSTDPGASIFSGDPGGSGPNINLSTGAGNFPLQLQSGGSIGTNTDPLQFSGGDLAMVANTGGLNAEFSGDANLVDLDLDFFTAPINTLTPSGNGMNSSIIRAEGDLILSATGDINSATGLASFSGGSIAFDATGDINIASGSTVESENHILVNGRSLSSDESSFLNAGVVALELDLGLGSANNLFSFETTDLLIGNTPTASYFLDTGGADSPDDVTWVNSVAVGSKTIVGNQFDTLVHEHTTRDIIVNADLNGASDTTLLATGTSASRPGDIVVNESVTASNTVRLSAAGNIIQGTNGSVVGNSAILNAGSNIGEITNDQQIDTSTLAASAGQNAFLQNTVGAVEVLDDPLLTGNLGANDQFRLQALNGDLTLSSDLIAGEAALVTGPDIDIPAQMLPGPNINLNANITTTNGNLVLLAGGSIVSNPTANLTVNSPTGGLGLGARGTVGPTNPINFNASQLALNPGGANVQTTGTPTSIPFVTAVGATVNGQQLTPNPNPNPNPVPNPNPGPNPIPNPDPTPNPDPLPNVGSLVGPEPTDTLFETVIVRDAVLAQDRTDLVEESLGEFQSIENAFDTLYDPTHIPAGWWDEDDFLRKKFRR